MIWNRNSAAVKSGDQAAEIARLREALAQKDQELSVLGRQLDDLLDRESMHVYDPDMERLATIAAIERQGAARVRRSPAQACPAARPELRVLSNISELTITAPRIDQGVWMGFDR
ncbi:hypothetical protein [Nocardia salmonicida]|uniref:hypothetical protein n=1 Tax=Nocardia salmonicida TaxID=53431 RepID=UPI0007A44304|nr:hypothetical protein [Nocardia salmonicida]